MIRALAMLSACVLFCIWLYKTLLRSPLFHRNVDELATSTDNFAGVIATHEEAARRRREFEERQRALSEEIKRDLEAVARSVGKNL